jgi:N utilization substance protein B
MGARRKGRETALQILYQMDVAAAPAEEAIELFWSNLGEGREGRDFATELVRGVAAQQPRIDELIRKASTNWRLERMARVDRNILRLGVFELLALPDVPRRVAINEAVELARRYGNEHSAAFVNGLLDKIAGELRKD